MEGNKMSTIGFGNVACSNQYNEIIQQQASAGFPYTMNKYWCGLKHEYNKKGKMITQGECDFVGCERDCPKHVERP